MMIGCAAAMLVFLMGGVLVGVNLLNLQVEQAPPTADIDAAYMTAETDESGQQQTVVDEQKVRDDLNKLIITLQQERASQAYADALFLGAQAPVDMNQALPAGAEPSEPAAEPADEPAATEKPAATSKPAAATSKPAATDKPAATAAATAKPTAAPTAKPTAAPTSAPVSTGKFSSALRYGDLVAQIEIPAAGISQYIYQGTDSAMLKRGVGHYINSGMPGDGRNILFSAHRDQHFRGLGGAGVGDTIKVTTARGTFIYTIYQTQKNVPKDDQQAFQNFGREVLVLSTCYPFNYIGTAPYRYLVFANLTSSSLN